MQYSMMELEDVFLKGRVVRYVALISVDGIFQRSKRYSRAQGVHNSELLPHNIQAMTKLVRRWSPRARSHLTILFNWRQANPAVKRTV